MFRSAKHWKKNAGGRAAAGYKGDAGDCVVRSIAIATGQPYQQVYNEVNALRDSMRQTFRIKKSSARDGVSRTVYERYLQNLGWRFVPTMKIGSGCKVHLTKRELPSGRIIVRVSKHMTAVIRRRDPRHARLLSRRQALRLRLLHPRHRPQRLASKITYRIQLGSWF
jgi:hypothetical protein